MKESVIILPYDEAWTEEFDRIGGLLREDLGEQALRIDHIGSTAVPGLHAKPVIDIQISVRQLEPMEYQAGLERAGYRHRADNEDLTKRYFREQAGQRRTHIHVREAGSWSEQFALLFRDYLRANEEERQNYAAEKQSLAALYSQPDEREAYVEGKNPIIWRIMQQASLWSQQTGWRVGTSDK